MDGWMDGWMDGDHGTHLVPAGRRPRQPMQHDERRPVPPRVARSSQAARAGVLGAARSLSVRPESMRAY